MTENPLYLGAVDVKQLLNDHPIGGDFETLARTLSRDELFARQDRLFRRCVAQAWRTGFYRRLWGAVGIEPGDIQGLEDIHKL
ncbi:MAG: phenylacetate--CoA ligase family protein, partial [Gammaproteobacteria bacterium]|nr:phenylacetate--CoA ligase family protein [Gammaproteobacteria bacterium]